MALLEIRNVTRRYGELAAVEDVSFSVEAGEFFTLFGPSGCGKTTLLRMIAGFEAPDAGQILLDGVDLADTRRKSAQSIPCSRATPSPGCRGQRVDS